MNRVTNGAPIATMDKSKDWQLEILMEKLRSKASQSKPFPEISKNVRMTMLDKRYVLDSIEKSQHQKCLDTLQHSIKITSLQSMVERLESLTRQLGLKFMVGPKGTELFISSDMFYLEVELNENGVVKDVKVHHESKMEQQSCTDLYNCLQRGDFADFTAQLEGFASIYQLNADKKIKCKAFTSLQSLESDLSTLAQLQLIIKEPFNIIHKSPVGALVKRRGGHPMKLTYFLPPYELLNVESCELEPLTADIIINKGLGYSVTVCMEGSATHKLQTTTLITVNRNINGKSSPSYSALNTQNSAAIPACFVLKLNKPMPMCKSLLGQIHKITELETGEQVSVPLLNLIVKHSSEGKMESGNNKGLFVTLPDQTHCYFLTENKTMDGCLISSVPFTHPAHVSQILELLRQQALFNTLIASCVRPNSRQDFDNMTMFEISALSSTHISLSLEHPTDESMATAELDLAEITSLKCRIQASSGSVSDLSTKVLNRSFSIPVTMRAVIKQLEVEVAKGYGGLGGGNGHQGENFSLPLGSGDSGGGGGGGKGGSGGGSMTEFGGLDKLDKIDGVKQEPQNNNNSQSLDSMITSSNFQETILSNIELTNILAGTGDKKKKKKTEDIWKMKRTDSDHFESSSSDSTSRSTPLSQDTEITSLGFPSDLEFSALDPTDLLNDKANDFSSLDELADVEEMLGPRRPSKSPTFDLEKALVPPSVSITPIATFEKRPGIEIIPLATSATNLSNSITITPIQSTRLGIGAPSLESKSSDDKSREKRKKEDRNRIDKKRKRKRDESPMGPPEKVPPKLDGLVKPLGVSVKASESPPLTITPTPTSPIRKFNASPTNRSGKLSPNLMKPLKTGTSPKHSPAHVPTSPKHSIPGVLSPKHHGTSPKHASTSGSGKPSMSTLKNAANSPSNKTGIASTEPTKKTNKDKEKNKTNFLVGGAPSKRVTSPKIKPLELQAEILATVPDGLPSPGGCNDPKANQVRNRKGSLSAIVDKLKSAQCDGVDLSGVKPPGGGAGAPTKQTPKVDGKSGVKVGEAKNSEYMVKPSSDGMKITINKTRTKDGMKPSVKTGTGSPKTHTGLKPGVTSGPASKKPQHLQKMQNATGNYIKSGVKLASSGSGAKLTTNKTKLTNSPKSGATDLSRKDRPKVNKSGDKSIFSMKDNRKGSPTQNDDVYNKLTKIDLFTAPLMMEGIMKQFDSKNFQIPKLSARSATATSIDDKKTKVVNDPINNVNRTVNTESSKIMEIINKTGANSDVTSLPKYPLAIPGSKMFEMAMDASKRASPKLIGEEEGRAAKDELKIPTPPPPPSVVGGGGGEPLSLTKSVEKFVAPAAPKDDKKDAKKMEEGLLDYSKGEKGVAMAFPASPSVSVHIVKSPAPSPLITPSPHSASPCITDDELMDEALIGMGK